MARKEEEKVEAINTFSIDARKRVYKGDLLMSRIEIDLSRVATWTLIFTNTFFVTYFFAKLFQLV